MTFVIARRLAYNQIIMLTASSDRRALKAKVRAVQRLLIKAYGEPPRPAWGRAGTSRRTLLEHVHRAELSDLAAVKQPQMNGS